MFSADNTRALEAAEPEAAGERSTAPAAEVVLKTLDIPGTAAHILRGGHKRVALQFPDELLRHATAVTRALKASLGSSAEPVELFELADTSFDGFQVDYVAAQHVNADLIVHYGAVDLDAEGPIPARLVLGERHIDVGALSAACAATFTGGHRVLVVPSLSYAYAAEALASRLAADCPGALVCRAEVERAAAPPAAKPAAASASAAAPSAAAPAAAEPAAAEPAEPFDAAAQLGRGRLLGRRLPSALDQSELEGLSLLYIGEEDQTLSNLCILLPNAETYLCTPPAAPEAGAAGGSAAGTPIVRLQLKTAARLMRRYYLVQKAKEAEVVGILIGSLSAAQRRPMLAAIKRLVRRAGRKPYVMVMGKLNEAKLANFLEVGVYVLLGSAEHSILDSKDFYRPVLTPFELHLALTPGAEWTGEYILDYGRLLPRLADADADADAADAGGARGGDSDGSGDEAPEFSLLSGKYIAKPSSRQRGDPAAEAGGGPLSGKLARSGGSQLAGRGEYALATDGAEFLARREYRGLEVRLGEHAPSIVTEGQHGIASTFEGEGVTQYPDLLASPQLRDHRGVVPKDVAQPEGAARGGEEEAAEAVAAVSLD